MNYLYQIKNEIVRKQSAFELQYKAQMTLLGGLCLSPGIAYTCLWWFRKPTAAFVSFGAYLVATGVASETFNKLAQEKQQIEDLKSGIQNRSRRINDSYGRRSSKRWWG